MDEDETELDEIAVSNLMEYLRFPTVHPNPNYYPTVAWLLGKGKELDLECSSIEMVPNNPIVVMCWSGLRPELPAILLNSHMDVVPVVVDKWKHPPFDATLIEGKIYARGAQDMKSVGIHQLEAIRRLKACGYKQLQRTIYLTFVPDEEVGGRCGMQPFVANLDKKLPIQFANMNIGLCLDEGLPSDTTDYVAYYDERRPCWMKVNFEGNSGHGLALINNTAAEKFCKFLDLIMAFRKQEKTRLQDSNGKLTLGDVTTVNLTQLSGGEQCNIIPSGLSATFDVRLTPSLSLEEWKQMLNNWAKIAGPDQIEFEFLNTGVDLQQSIKYPDIKANIWWSCLTNVCNRAGAQLQVRVFPGATDARFVRQFHLLSQFTGSKPIVAIGFSAIRQTTVLLHDHDEYIERQEFIRGCRLYAHLVRELGNSC